MTRKFLDDNGLTYFWGKLKPMLAGKQDTLVSGTNIKTINSTSVLGSGDISVQETLTSGTNIKTINNTSVLGSGDIDTTPPVATESVSGTIKLNSAKSISLNTDGKLEVGGRLGQFEGTTGLFSPNDREPRDVQNYSLLITDAKGLSLGNRALAIVSGLGVSCQSAAAGSTEYKLTNNYVNRIVAKCCEGGYIALDEATSTQQQVEPVVSVTIGGSTFIPDSTANSSTPIIIKVANTINPDSATSNIRLFGDMKSYSTAHLGNGVCSVGSGGRSVMIGGGITKTGGNDVCMIGQQMFNTGNGNAMFGRNHIARKNRGFFAGSGHDGTNAKTEAVAALGEYSLISSDTAFAIGNGTSHTARSNLFEIKTNGDIYKNGTKVL